MSSLVLVNPASCLVCCLDLWQESLLRYNSFLFSSVFGIYVNVHNRWRVALHNATLEGGKHQDKLEHSEWKSLLNPKNSSSDDATDGSRNILNFVYGCFQPLPRFLFAGVRAHAREAAASIRSCDFPKPRETEGGGRNHLSAAQRVQSAPLTNHFYSTGLDDRAPDHHLQ